MSSKNCKNYDSLVRQEECNTGINVEIDLLPCNKCNKWHPTLYWHDKYDDYLLDRYEKWLESKKKRPKLFKGAVYVDSLPAKGLEERELQGNCCVCGHKTYFVSVRTKRYVCSDECRYIDELGKSK